MKKSTRGFTIVELLIVIAVIAILAAISIVAYNGIQARARDSTRKSDLAAMAKALEVRAIDYSYTLRHSIPSPGDITCAASSSSGWLSLANSGASYGPKSGAQCLKEEAKIATEFKDPTGATNCVASSPSTCFAYLFCSTGATTYIMAHLENEPLSTTVMDGTCGAAWDDAYGVNYFVKATAYTN